MQTVRAPPAAKNQYVSGTAPVTNALNSTRSVVQKQSKLIDSKLSSLRHEQDSTAASNINNRFPMTPEEAYKVLEPYLWDVEKREIFEYKTIYYFNIEERKK